MDFFETVAARVSTRSFTDQAVSDETLTQILTAAAAAPSAGGAAPWEFVVLRSAEQLAAVAQCNPYAGFATEASAAVVFCLNTHKERFPGNGPLDVSMAAQTAWLAAAALGVGAVFTGIYPEIDRIGKFSAALKLPSGVIPIGMMLFGYPAEHLTKTRTLDPAVVHKEVW